MHYATNGEPRLYWIKSAGITVNVREAEYDKLASLAETHNVSTSRIARQSLCKFLERYGKSILNYH